VSFDVLFAAPIILLVGLLFIVFVWDCISQGQLHSNSISMSFCAHIQATPALWLATRCVTVRRCERLANAARIS